jgi:DNA polymerase III subunit delta
MAAKKTTKPANASTGFKSVYVIFGQDSYLVRQKVDGLMDSLLKPDQREMALYQPEAEKANGPEVLDELRTLPFLAERRVVLIKDAEPFVTAFGELLEKYLDSPSPTGVLILTVESWDKRKRLAKKIAAGGNAELIEISEIKPWEMKGFVTGYAQDKGVRLAPDAADWIIELVGNVPGRLVAELDKLILFKHPAKTISATDVEKLIGNNRVFDAFEVIESLSGEQRPKAFDRLRRMFGADKEAEYRVIGAFAFHFRRLFRVKAMIEKGESEKSAMLKSGITYPKIQEKCQAQIRRYSLENIGQLLGELGVMDWQSKTGQGDVASTMEKFFLRVITLAQK